MYSTTKYYIYIHNLVYVKVLRKMQQTKSVNTIVSIPDLVIIKYFGNNTTEIKGIVFTCPDLLPSALVVELELSNKTIPCQFQRPQVKFSFPLHKKMRSLRVRLSSEIKSLAFITRGTLRQAFITRGTLRQAFKLPTACRSFYSKKKRLSLENCAFLGHYAANRGNFLPTFRQTTYRFHLQGFLGSF